jgi:hypothetical protein
MNTTITAKLAAYFVSRRKFGDYGCYLMTPAVENLLGLTPEEMNSPWRSAETLVLAMKKAYPETVQDFGVYVFGEEGVDDEKVFDAWIEKLKAGSGGVVVALFGIDKLKEKILLRGLLATHRSYQLHVVIFQNKFEGDIAPYIWQNAANAEDINPSNPLMARPSRPIPKPQPEQPQFQDQELQEVVPQVAPEIATEPDAPEFVPEFVKEVVTQNAERSASEHTQKQPVAGPVRPSVEKVVEEVVREVVQEPVIPKSKQGKVEGFQIADPDESFHIEKAKTQLKEEIKAEPVQEAVQEGDGVRIQLPIAKVPAHKAIRPDQPKPNPQYSPNNHIARYLASQNK